MSMIQAYAPTTDHSYEEVEQFYEKLENIIRTVPKNDVLVMMRDWNAKISVDAMKTGLEL